MYLFNLLGKELQKMVDLAVEIAGIVLPCPIMNAAGCLDIEPPGVRELVQIDKVGAYVQKGITLRPREGSPQPRLCEVRNGIINKIGLQNVGVGRFVKEKLPIIHMFKPIDVPLIVNVAGESINDYLAVAAVLEAKSHNRIVALEINVSCPNMANGLVFGSDAYLLWELIMSLKTKISLPIIVKLTPNVKEIGLMAEAAASAGADILSLINTVKAKARIKRGSYAGQWVEGGLSGPAIKKIALGKTKEVAEKVDLPIIAMGGIRSAQDALEFLRIKNVWAVALGTALFKTPWAMVEVRTGLERYLVENGYPNIAAFKAIEAC